MNKFGMFIHWGIYSLTELHEQAIARYDISYREYDALVDKFNPTEYNPEEWVLLAKNAGMKYICFTAKHHDGFCMWDTKYTDYNVMNTPYGRDVLKMLADACKKHGMLLSIYYSNPDWNHKSGYNYHSTHQWKSRNQDANDLMVYRQFIKNQITELLSNYGKIYTLFWDIPPRYVDKSINELARSLQPDILINDRGWDSGDFSTPERTVPDGMRFERMTEACQSVGEQAWGYRKDEDYYSTKYLLSSIDKVMAMGGSYLLNVGPMPNGKIPKKSIEIINKIGNWYNRMNGVLEDHTPLDVVLQIAKDVPYIANTKNGKTYVHLYNGHYSSALTITYGPCFPPKKAVLLNDGRELRVRKDLLPGWGGYNGEAPGPYISIADIPCDEFEGEPLVVEIEW